MFTRSILFPLFAPHGRAAAAHTTPTPIAADTTEGLSADDAPITEAAHMLDMDPELEKLIPWRIVNFQQERQFTRPYKAADGTSSLRLGQAICRLKASTDEAPFYVPMTVSRLTLANGTKLTRISLPATQRGGGAWAQGALRTDSARGKMALEIWKQAVLNPDPKKPGPFMRWAATQDWTAFNQAVNAAINPGVVMDIPGLTV